MTDEVHTEVSMTVMTVHMFKTFSSDMRKWFLTDTPFESFSAQMALWINFIETPFWINPICSSWSKKNMHQKRLKQCTSAMLHEMKKMHKHIVNEKKLNVIVKRKYLTNLTIVLNTLWLKCSASQFTFYEHSLTDVSLNMHQSIDCSLLNWFADLVNASVVIISSKMKIWQDNNCLRDESMLNLNNWLHKVRRLQVLSMFSMLEILKATKDLTLTEIEDRQKDWICN